MEATASRKLNCQICGRSFLPQNGAIGENVRPSLAEFIKSQQPNWDPQQFICFGDLGAFRKDYVKRALEDEIGELSTLDHEVIESLREHEVLSENIEKQFERKLSFGEHLSDKIAEFGGSWKFIIAFGGVLVVWIIINGVLLATRAFDPYPFILLNLILSCLAALQAPIIMMSQNRAEVRDRLRAENDYKVNLKADAWINTMRTADRVFGCAMLNEWRQCHIMLASPTGRSLHSYVPDTSELHILRVGSRLGEATKFMHGMPQTAVRCL
jgi:uncharacterized membrane protein